MGNLTGFMRIVVFVVAIWAIWFFFIGGFDNVA